MRKHFLVITLYQCLMFLLPSYCINISDTRYVMDEDIPNINAKSAALLDDLIEGDIFVGAGVKLMKNIHGVKSGGVCLSCKKWPLSEDGEVYEIPYEFANEYLSNEYEIISWAMQYIGQVTNIRFIPRSDEDDYVSIFDGPGCYSALGRAGGGQPLSLSRPLPDGKGSHCMFKRIVVHELLHAVGLGHEHQRADRDEYIDVRLENVDPQNYSQLDILYFIDAGSISPYDVWSVMHYGTKSFSINDQAVLLGRNTDIQSALDSRHVLLTSCDVRALNTMYPGEKQAPTCFPGQPPQGIEPKSTCFKKFGESECFIMCGIQGAAFIEKDDQPCQFVGGGAFPPPLEDIEMPEEEISHKCTIPLTPCERYIYDENNKLANKLLCEYPCRFLCTASDKPEECAARFAKSTECIEVASPSVRITDCGCQDAMSLHTDLLTDRMCLELCETCMAKGDCEPLRSLCTGF